MNPLKMNFSESKDQAVPFALPALRSYKQNLLFHELGRKSSEFSNEQRLGIELSPDNDGKSQILKRNSNGLKMGQSLNKTLNQMSQKPLVKRKEEVKIERKDIKGKDINDEKGREKAGEVRDKSLEGEFPKKIQKNLKILNYEKPKTNQNPKKIDKPSTTKVQAKPSSTSNIQTKNPKTSSPCSKLISSPSSKPPGPETKPSKNQNHEKTHLKPENNPNPSDPIQKPLTSYFQMRSRLNPAILSKSDHSDPFKRSESESSKSSSKFPPKTPEAFLRKFPETKAIPEYLPKRSRASATRSVSRRNPRHLQKVLLELDPLFFKMSDLSIAPLL
jgi:hypothetical protein